MKNEKKGFKKRNLELLGALLLIVVFMGPLLAFAGGRGNIYVDAKATGAQDGSAARPYKTISEALKHSDKRTDVHVAKGEYKENIEIPKGVRIFGSDEDQVIITASNDDNSVVVMKDESRINKVTIRKGKSGIRVKEDAKVSIIECIIKDNDDDGITIEEGSVKKSRSVSITENVIKDNGRSGIFSKERRLVLIDNEVSGNNSDGIDIAAGSSAWIEDNRIKDNEGSGLKLTLDGSNIWTKSNSFRENDNEGVEINSFGKAGRIDINKSKFSGNEKFAIARINRIGTGTSIWNGLTVQTNTTFENSKKGNVSPVIFVK
jgi:hypothetical protein